MKFERIAEIIESDTIFRISIILQIAENKFFVMYICIIFIKSRGIKIELCRDYVHKTFSNDRAVWVRRMDKRRKTEKIDHDSLTLSRSQFRCTIVSVRRTGR